MTLSHFKALQASKNWQHFIFNSENQRKSAFWPLSMDMTFDAVLVGQNPNCLFFTAGERSEGQRRYPFSMTINGVESVEFVEASALGDWFKVTCRGGKRYTILAQ